MIVAQIDREQVKKILADLNEISAKRGRDIVRKSTRTAAKEILLPQAKSNVPVRSGQLKRAIKVRAIQRSKNAVGVRVSASEKDFTGDQFYASFIELGWRSGKRSSEILQIQRGLRERIKSSQKRAEELANVAEDSRKLNPGRQFLRRAADLKGEAAAQRATELISKEIKEYWERG
jgi:hypothetical protein